MGDIQQICGKQIIILYFIYLINKIILHYLTLAFKEGTYEDLFIRRQS